MNKYDNGKIQLGITISRHRENTPVQLKLGNVSGAFILWAMGLSLAAIFFIAEHIRYAISKKKLFPIMKVGPIEQIERKTPF